MNVNSKADIFIPDSTEQKNALTRTTHLCIGAHQDDIEIMAWNGILECLDSQDKWFTGVVVSDGAGSARSGPYSDFSDEDMKATRIKEQQEAAKLGLYSAMIQLLYPTSLVKEGNEAVIADLAKILKATQPQILYLHNPADKHDTHVAVVQRTLEALRKLPKSERPEKVYGCEVWRDLDWLPDVEKVTLSTDGNPELEEMLLKVFDSQITGGKRYDLATLGRRLANATFFESHATDQSQGLTYAMDLTPLFEDDTLSLENFVEEKLKEFQNDVIERIKRLG